MATLADFGAGRLRHGLQPEQGETTAQQHRSNPFADIAS
jgi:hypothetical protein